MKHLCTILATAIAAAFAASAKTFDWPIDSPAAGARQFTAYHGETVRFNLRLSGAMTNLAPVAIYYQTNGMGKAEWFGPVPGTVFHPTNDCGAAAYRFFILCNDPDGKDYTANGSLRLLDSPGFVPNEVPFPARRIDFAQVEVLNPPWPGVSAVETVASNAAVAATAPRFRPFGDEYVYESTGMGDFTWSSDRQDVLAALGTMQPNLGYEYDNYGEWHLDFYIGATNYYGYAWAPLNSPEVEFYVDGWFWDEATGDEHYDYAVVVGHRAPGGYNRANPVDTFAHQSEVTLMHAKITSISNLVVGETKVLRTGEPGQLGTGWGFIQSRLDDEHRYWRIQVPKITIQGLEQYSPSATRSYINQSGSSVYANSALSYTRREIQVRAGQTTTNFYGHTATWEPLQANLLKKYPGWNTYGYALKRTIGAYSIDKVVAASYKLGIMPQSTNSSVFAVNYDIDASIIGPNNKQSFLITLDKDRLLANGFSERAIGDTMTYYRPIEPIECVVTSIVTVAIQYSSINVTNRFSAVVNGIGIKVPQTNELWNGRSPYITLPIYYDFDFNFVADCHVNPGDGEYYYPGYGSTPYTNYIHVVENYYTTSQAVEHAMMNQDVRINYPGTINNSDYTFNTYEDRYATYYKIVTTLDPYSHMYYDPAMDATFRISVYNGTFFAEKVLDGDWRDHQGDIPPANDLEER